MLALVSLVAHAATAIGHPDVHFADATDLTFDTFAVWVEDLQLRRCDGQPLTVEVDALVEAGDPLPLPTGCFDRLRLHTTWLAATGSGNGGTFELDLAPGEIDVQLPAAFAIPGTLASSLVLGEPDWVTASMLGLSAGIHRTVDSGDTLYAPLSLAIRDDSALTW
jgi:hypothetical protein